MSARSRRSLRSRLHALTSLRGKGYRSATLTATVLPAPAAHRPGLRSRMQRARPSRSLRRHLHALTALRGMRWFNTCRWLCQPLRRSVCVYGPGCNAPWVNEARLRRLKAHPSWTCAHTNRRPNPNATAIKAPDKAQTCIDCGIGLVTFARAQTP